MNFLKRWFFLFCNDLIFFLFSVYYFISLVVFRSKWSLYWNAPFERLHQFLIQPSLFRSVQMSDIRSGMYEYIFFIHSQCSRKAFFGFIVFFFLLQKFKMLTTTMLWPHILQITTRRHCCAISRKKYVMIIMVYSFYFQGPVFCPDPESDSLSHQQYDLVGLSTGATNWCNVGAFTRIAQ